MSISSKIILIIGGGKVGLDALNFCEKNNYIAIIMDNNPNCLVRPKVEIIESKDYLQIINNIQEIKSALFIMKLDKVINLIKYINFEYLIPAVPIHLMAKLSMDYLSQKNLKIHPSSDIIQIVKKKIDKKLIYNYNKEKGIIVASFMPIGQTCAPNCIEPIKCPVTGIIKQKPLFEKFNELSKEKEFSSIHLISEQLEPNLGGISRKAIINLFKFLDNVNQHFIISTACKCHGIINSFEFK